VSATARLTATPPQATPARAQLAPAQAAPARAAGPWILSAAQDLLWFQGSVLAGLVLLALFRLIPPTAAAGSWAQPALLVLLAWGVLFDGTHVMGTWARSYLTPDPASRAGLPGRRWLVLLAVGPAIAVADHVASPAAAGLRAGGPLFALFLLFALSWAYFHLVRQHWGFVGLYRRRAPQDPTPARLDEAALWLGCLHPFVRFSLTPAYAAAGLPQLLPPGALGGARLALDLGCGLAALLLAGLWLARGGHRGLGPRHLLLALVIGFHALVFALLTDLLAIMATLTIFHNVQYHRIVWQHEAGKGRRPLGGLVAYVGAGLALGLVWYLPRVLGVQAAGPGLVRNVLVGLGWGIAFHHYLVDGRIWRVRRSPAVGRAIDAGARS
jgi:hypothetical protein